MQQLKNFNLNFDQPQIVEFYFYFPTSKLARKADKEMIDEGYGVTIKLVDEKDAWLCFTTKEIVPSPEELGRLRKRFEAIAEKYNGEYDGWDAGFINEGNI